MSRPGPVARLAAAALVVIGVSAPAPVPAQDAMSVAVAIAPQTDAILGELAAALAATSVIGLRICPETKSFIT